MPPKRVEVGLAVFEEEEEPSEEWREYSKRQDGTTQHGHTRLGSLVRLHTSSGNVSFRGREPFHLTGGFNGPEKGNAPMHHQFVRKGRSRGGGINLHPVKVHVPF